MAQREVRHTFMAVAGASGIEQRFELRFRHLFWQEPRQLASPEAGATSDTVLRPIFRQAEMLLLGR